MLSVNCTFFLIQFVYFSYYYVIIFLQTCVKPFFCLFLAKRPQILHNSSLFGYRVFMNPWTKIEFYSKEVYNIKTNHHPSGDDLL